MPTKRFDVTQCESEDCDAHAEEHASGEFVEYADHVAVVDKLDVAEKALDEVADEVRKALEAIAKPR
jgi:hypothetical protein